MNTTDTPMEPSAKDVATDPELTGTEKWAICCSGGGIRSASYCLGALQGLEEAGFLGKARLILGVSGGSYIAASRALVAHGLEQTAAGQGAASARLAPYAPGSPEEQHLRDNRDTSHPTPRPCWPGAFAAVRRGGHLGSGPHPAIRGGACLGLGAAGRGSADLHYGASFPHAAVDGS